MSGQNQGMDSSLLVMLGEIRGELSGIRSQIAESNVATNRRIDDLSETVRGQTDSLNQRLDDHQQITDGRLGGLESRVQGLEATMKGLKDNSHTHTVESGGLINGDRKAAAVAGGGVSALVASAVEIIRQVSG